MKNVLKYDGNNMLLPDWVERLRTAARLYEVPAAHQTNLALNALEGDARQAVIVLPLKQWNTIDAFLGRLESLYGDVTFATDLQKKFYTRIQQEGESVQQFSVALQVLWKQLMKKDQEGCSAVLNADRLLRDQFISGLRCRMTRRALWDYVRLADDGSLQDVMREAIVLTKDEMESACVAVQELQHRETPGNTFYEFAKDLCDSLREPKDEISQLKHSGGEANLLTFLIFWRSNCGLSPSCRCYMMAIAVADTLVLIQIVILEMILKFYTLEPFWSRGPWCMIRDLLTYGAYNASVWLVVCFTIERFIAIRAVCVKPKICTKICTLYLIGAVFFCSHLLSIPYLWSNESKPLNGTNGFICVYNSQLTKLYVDCLVWLQNTLVYIIPLIIIFTLNGFILKQICQSNKVHSEIQQNRKSFLAFVMVKKQRLKSMVLLVTISMTFSYLCTTRFVTQVLIKTMHYDIDREDYSKSINIAADMGTMLDLSNSAVNMYLYACTQPRFRKEIIQLVKSLTNIRHSLDRKE
ncbi:probable G-protein coupled receptor 139, partial [Bufo gargarizans]|uniref:probable G-protein coupled receptor 139 n=1 Tax=Bufo gargarizans TaxID=30331 RepID=UPI001CF19CDD